MFVKCLKGKSHANYLLMPLVLIFLCGGCISSKSPTQYFTIKVVDEQTGRGVPLVELRTVNDIRYYTDSHGIVGFYEPGLMNRKVFFHIQSHGYEADADGFGYRGTTLFTIPGDSQTIRIRRKNVAERLYRITGQGIYRDTVLVGLTPPLANSVLNGRVLGQDTVMATAYKGKIYWFWGDTDRESYPLGHFATAGATSELPSKGGLDPSVGVDLKYFVDDEGFSKKMAPLSGGGMIWIDALMVLEDEECRERLLAHYQRMADLDKCLEHGLLVFDDEKEVFEKLAEFPLDSKLRPQGQTLKVNVNGSDYFYFAGSPYPLVRVEADWKLVADTKNYESYTCLKEGSSHDRESAELDRRDDGSLNWDWKKDTAAIDVVEQSELLEDGRIGPEEAWLNLKDVETGEEVMAHRGSVCWNAYRKRWIMIVGQVQGTSNLGEIWYSEADAPHGPWRWAQKIATHDRYSFYNPTQHEFFDQQGGRIVYFEGTYSTSFSGAPLPTPRYDYNQIMYRLDLSDARLRSIEQRGK
jgi:hypothetical protein